MFGSTPRPQSRMRYQAAVYSVDEAIPFCFPGVGCAIWSPLSVSFLLISLSGSGILERLVSIVDQSHLGILSSTRTFAHAFTRTRPLLQCTVLHPDVEESC